MAYQADKDAVDELYFNPSDDDEHMDELKNIVRNVGAISYDQQNQRPGFRYETGRFIHHTKEFANQHHFLYAFG